MDAASGAAFSQASAAQQVQTGVLRTALDNQQAQAEQLIEGVDQPGATASNGGSSAGSGSGVDPGERVGSLVNTRA